MELKFPFGTVRNAQNRMFQSLENTTNHGKKNVQSVTVPNATLQNLLEKRELLIPGWILASAIGSQELQ